MNAAVTNPPSAPAHPPQAAPDIRERFAAARAAGKRAKDAAESLGLSEGAAVAAHAGEHGHLLKAQPLQGSWLELLQSLEACGPLMALTRNEGTVHEKTGVYTHVSATGPVGIALGEDIDLRLFFAQWHAGFAVTELAHDAAQDPTKPPSRSLQFYNAHGRAVHKIFTRDATDLAAFDAVVSRFVQPSAGYVFGPEPAPAGRAARRRHRRPGLARGLGCHAGHARVLRPDQEIRRGAPAELSPGRRPVCLARRTAGRGAPAGRSGGGRPAHHGVCGQRRLHPDPHRAGAQHPAARYAACAVDQRAGRRLQPAPAHRHDRQRVGGGEAHGRWRGHLGRGVRPRGRADGHVLRCTQARQARAAGLARPGGTACLACRSWPMLRDPMAVQSWGQVARVGGCCAVWRLCLGCLRWGPGPPGPPARRASSRWAAR